MRQISSYETNQGKSICSYWFSNLFLSPQFEQCWLGGLDQSSLGIFRGCELIAWNAQRDQLVRWALSEEIHACWENGSLKLVKWGMKHCENEHVNVVVWSVGNELRKVNWRHQRSMMMRWGASTVYPAIRCHNILYPYRIKVMGLV